MEVIYHRLVVRDLRVALHYYESEGGAQLADRFFVEVEESVPRLISQTTGGGTTSSPMIRVGAFEEGLVEIIIRVLEVGWDGE